MYTNVYLVNVSQKVRTLHFPLGLGFIAKSLLMNEIPFQVIDLLQIPYEKREDSFKKTLASVTAPSIFGFSIMAGNGQIKEAEKFAKLVKESDCNHGVVFGGPLPSAIPELCIEKTDADYAILGEGEESFPLFVKNYQSKDFKNITGLAYRDSDGRIIINKKKRVSNLDEYSPIPYELFSMPFYINYLEKTNRCFEISGSRGCRGACKFCFRFSGPGLTSRTGNSLFDEVKHVYDTYGIDRFNFTDENFLEEKGSFNGFLDLLEKENINIKFRGQTRVDEITDEFCSSLAKRGLLSINFGVESADDEMLRKIAKGIKIKDIEDKIRMMRSYGIEVFASVILGFPWETINTIKANKDFIIRNNLQGRCTVNYLAPLPATKLYEEAKKMKLIADDWEYIRNLGYLYRDRSINMTTLDKDEIGLYYEELLQLGEPDTTKVTSEYAGILEDASIECR